AIPGTRRLVLASRETRRSTWLPLEPPGISRNGAPRGERRNSLPFPTDATQPLPQSFSGRDPDGLAGALGEISRQTHPAGLNYGYCFSYALAVTRDEHVLFIDNNFARTNLK